MPSSDDPIVPRQRTRRRWSLPMLDSPVALLLSLPSDWETVVGRRDDLPLVSVSPPGPSPFRSSLVVTLDRLARATAIDEWQRSVETELATRFQDYVLLDLERIELCGRPGARRLASHRSGPGLSVTMEQRVTAVHAVGVTITVTVASPLFPAERHVFRRWVDAARLVAIGATST